MKLFTIATIAASATLLTAQAMAASTAPLAPGKLAGVHQAQDTQGLLLPAAIAAGAIAVIIVATSGGNGNLATAPVVSTTSSSAS